MWLHRSHPNFFVVFSATLAFHLVQLGIGLFVDPSAVATPSLYYCNLLAPPAGWGAMFGIVALGMTAGLRNRDWWHLARLALTIGAILTGVRAVLIAMACVRLDAPGITGVPVWLLVAALHLSQAGEPPSNPASAQDG